MKIKDLFNSKKKIAGVALIGVAVVIAAVSLTTTLGVNDARKASLKEYEEMSAEETEKTAAIISENEDILPEYDVNDNDINTMREEVLRISNEGGTPEEKAEKLLEYSRKNQLPAADIRTENVEMTVNYGVKNSEKKSGNVTKTSSSSKKNTNNKSAAQNTKKVNSSSTAKKSLGTNNAVTQTPKKLIPDGTVLGIINIPSIACRETIKEGTTNAVLKSAVGHMDGTSFPGFPGNCVIMGHRNYTYGLFFNRLNEVKAGDLVTVETNGVTRTYMVYASYVVQPDDYSESVQTGLNEITLVTCTPIYIATHRLVVKAVLVG